MAVMQLSFTSQYLHVNTNVTVVFPDVGRDDTPRQFYERDQKFRVLWLLPGLECNHSRWLRETNVERYACQQETVVVMPSAQNSDYIDWNSFSTGFEACSFFLQELMPLVQAWFPVSAERSKNAIAGVTDAPIRLALLHPERFEAAFKLQDPLTDYDALLADWEPLGLLAEGQSRACRKWRESAPPEALRLLNTVDNIGGRERFLASDCNVLRTLSGLTQKERAAMPRLHFFAGKPDAGFSRFLHRLVEQGALVDILQLPVREDVWEQLDCALKAVLRQYERGDHTWR